MLTSPQMHPTDTPPHYGAIALIPCYNSRKYIRQAVLGLLNQTRPLDLIVVLNDCSTDNFQEEIADLVEQHENLIIHDNPRNLGRSGCRNEGFDCFDADYYFLNDADDVSLPDRVQKTLDFMEANPNFGIVGGFVEYITPQGKVFGKGTQMYCLSAEDAKRYRESLEPLGLFCSTVCLRGEVIRKDNMRFDPTLPASEDIELWNLVLEKGWDVISLQEYFTQYRMHDDSICTSRFIYCRHYQEYVVNRLVRRRSNQTPVTFEEFVNSKRTEGLWKWLKFEYPIYVDYFYRTGGYKLISGSVIKGACMLAISMLMSPSRLRRLIYQRLGKKL